MKTMDPYDTDDDIDVHYDWNANCIRKPEKIQIKINVDSPKFLDPPKYTNSPQHAHRSDSNAFAKILKLNIQLVIR